MAGTWIWDLMGRAAGMNSITVLSSHSAHSGLGLAGVGDLPGGPGCAPGEMVATWTGGMGTVESHGPPRENRVEGQKGGANGGGRRRGGGGTWGACGLGA